MEYDLNLGTQGSVLKQTGSPNALSIIKRGVEYATMAYRKMSCLGMIIKTSSSQLLRLIFFPAQSLWLMLKFNYGCN